MPAPHHSVFYRLDALPGAQQTVLKALKTQHCIEVKEGAICIQRKVKVGAYGWTDSEP